MNHPARIIKGGIAVDDRGSIRFCNDFDFSGVKRFYEVENHRRGFVRAWHGHEREGKYVWAACGSFLVAAVKLDAEQGDVSAVAKFIVSDSQPAVLWIPPGHFNGFMNLTEHGRLIFFSTSTLEESKDDDIRLSYDAWDIWQEVFR